MEDNLVKDGCQNPLFVWHGFIADGHNRYKICQKHKIPFAIAELGFDDKSEVMRWMIDGQLGRRNLSPIQRVAVTEKYRPVFEEKAKENISKAVSESNSNRSISSPQKSADMKNWSYRNRISRLIQYILLMNSLNLYEEKGKRKTKGISW